MLMKNESFFKTIKSFLDVYLIKQKNYSKNTQKSYRESISLLLQYFKDELGMSFTQIGFDQINYANISGYLAWLECERGCGNQTINLRLTAIRSLTKYASILDPAKIAIQIDIRNVSAKKGGAKVVEFLSEEALECLFLQPDTTKSNGVRDRFFMILMHDVAARCQEMLDLRLGDLELKKSNSSIYLTGKGSKSRRLPMSEKVVQHLQSYLNSFHPLQTRADEDYLFYTIIHGERHKMSTDAVSAFMKQYGIKGQAFFSQVPARVHPHQLRHTRAMHLYRGGMPLVLLAEFLGHANVNTTRIYAWADTEMKRQAIQKISAKTKSDCDVIPIWKNDEEMIKKLYGLA